VSHQLRRTRLSEVADFRNGINFSKSANGNSVRMVGVGSFLQREVIDSTMDLPHVRVDQPLRADDFLDPGDLLFVRSNGSKSLVGRCVTFKGDPGSTSFSGFTIRARVRDQTVDVDFVGAVVRSPHFREHLERLGRGSSITNLSQPALGDFEFVVPPLGEQKMIVKILGAWDDAVTKLREIKAAELQRRQWIRASVLTGNSRPQGFTADWTRAPLSSVLHEHKEKSTGTEEVYSVSVHRGLVNQIEHLGRSFSAANNDHYNLVRPGDVVYTKSPTGEFPLGILKQSRTNEAVLVSPLYGVFSPRTRELGTILDALFESPKATANYLRPLVQKGAKNTIAITNRRFLEGQLKLPLEPTEQMSLARLVEDSANELALLDREIALLREQKRGLMQKLLSGDVRVTAESEENSS
jgi:type I restriction enzyme S subunit